MSDAAPQPAVTRVQLPDEQATVALGGGLAEQLLTRYQGDALVLLRGQLGAGKTTVVRGLLRRLGYQGVVKSPTYTLLEPYVIDGLEIFHFDLYRVRDPQELEFVGIDEIVDGPGIKLFEWPEHAAQWLPAADLEVDLEVVGAGKMQRSQPPAENDNGLQTIPAEQSLDNRSPARIAHVRYA